MGFFKKANTGGLMDVIRCDESAYLIWKWHPRNSQPGNNDKENAIRWGSSLRVKDGEVAVFVYKQKNGTMQDFVVGPFDQIIETKNLPILTDIIGLTYDGETPFQAEIYFINLAHIVQVDFGVPFFDIYDPRFLDFGVPVAVRGKITFRIEDYKSFIKLHKLNTFSMNEFQVQIRDAVCRYVKDCVANAPAANDIPVVQIETKISQINDVIEYDIKERLKENFGVVVSGVDINAIEIDKSSDGYQQLMLVTRNLVAEKMQAEKEDYIERLRIQREEGQYAQHKSTQSANISAFQLEKQTEVGVAGAEALGQMGQNGAGNVNLSDGGAGFNPASIMAGMAVGGAIGQNIAGSLNGMLNVPSQQPVPPIVPPPIPVTSYHVVVNGTSTGPYDTNAIIQMINSQQISEDTLLWTAGMENWEKAKNIPEIAKSFQK